MREQILSRFVDQGSWFERRFGRDCGARFPTFKVALNLWLQRSGQHIVETGCVRMANDFGAGYSTVLFGEVVNRYGGLVWSIDIDPCNLNTACTVLGPLGVNCRLMLGDSVDVLKHKLREQAEFPGKIDLLYLDSLDYPMTELAHRCGCVDEVTMRTQYPDWPDDDIAERHADLVLPPQKHCLRELEAALPLLHARSIVLIDDNHLPGGGKPRLAKRRLAELGWHCLYDSQQTLWVRP